MSSFDIEKDLRREDQEELDAMKDLCRAAVADGHTAVARIALHAFKQSLASRYYYAGPRFGYLRFPR